MFHETCRWPVRTGAVLALLTAGWCSAGHADPDNTGSSGLFVSTDPAIAEVRDLIAQGRLSDAERRLDALSGSSRKDLERTAVQAREIIRRMRIEYRLSADDLAHRLRGQIPSVTSADIQRWTASGQVQHRLIDGQILYFRREPSNLFRFCPEARRLRDEHAASRPASAAAEAGPTATERLHAHLAEVIADARREDRAVVRPLRHRITYRLTVLPDRPGARSGSQVRCWLPFPQVYRQQTDVRLIRTSPGDPMVAPNGFDGTAVTGAPQRTVYLEQTITDPARPVVFEEEFEYVSSAYNPALSDDMARPLPPGTHAEYLAERPPHIVFTPEVRRTVEQVAGSQANPLARARLIFAFIDREIRYCAEEEYSTIPSFTIKALETRRGDCGIQSMLFITLCRAAGIPARWQSGWQTQPGAWNMHDWAEFYCEPWGWLPADPSNGLQASDEAEIRWFYFGHLDAYRLIVNLDYGAPLIPAKTSLRSEPADFQRGEVELDGRNLYFDEWDWDFRFEQEPAAGAQE